MLSALRMQLQFIFLILFFYSQTIYSDTSVLRLKTGVSNISLTSGDRLQNTPLKSMINFTPTVLWDFPSFSSRFGLHYLMEINSPFGLTPMSGIGISAYYHIFGITTGFEFTQDEVLIQKSKPGPYIYLGLTPVNLNINQFNTTDATADNYFFSAYVNDISIGLGYDYPFSDNMTFSSEFVLRNGRTTESTADAVEYAGWTLFFTLGTTYF